MVVSNEYSWRITLCNNNGWLLLDQRGIHLRVCEKTKGLNERKWCYSSLSKNNKNPFKNIHEGTKLKNVQTTEEVDLI